jgi:hypothetical protein
MKRKLHPSELDLSVIEKKFDDYLRNEKKLTEQQYENCTKDMGIFNVGGIKGEHGYNIMGGVNPAFALHLMDFQEKYPQYFERVLVPIHYDQWLKMYFEDKKLDEKLSRYNNETKKNLNRIQFTVLLMFLDLHKQIRENKKMRNQEVYALIKEHSFNSQRFLYSVRAKKVDVSVFLFRDIFYEYFPEMAKDYWVQQCFK